MVANCSRPFLPGMLLIHGLTGASRAERREGLIPPQEPRATLGQVTLPAHGPPHHDVTTGQFVEEDVLIEGSREEEEAPFAKPRVSETTAWPESRMLAK